MHVEMHISQRKNSISISECLLGTIVTISLYNKDQKKLDIAFELFRLIVEYEKRFSFFIKDSELSNINRLALLSETKVSEDMFTLLKISKDIFYMTDGLFNPTIGKLINFWSIPRYSKNLFKREYLKTYTIGASFDNVELKDEDGFAVRFYSKNISINLGGIAKGFILKKIVEAAISMGLGEFIIDLGGDLYPFSISDRLYKIGIPNPIAKNEVMIAIKMNNSAIATSGTYERFFCYKNRIFSHIINPETLFPVGGFCSSTVIYKDPIIADALATVLLFCDKNMRKLIIEEFKGIEVIILKNNHINFISDNLRDLIE